MNVNAKALFEGLPKQFQAKLNLPSVASLGDLSEVGVPNHAVGVLELGVVPRVEELLDFILLATSWVG